MGNSASVAGPQAAAIRLLALAFAGDHLNNFEPPIQEPLVMLAAFITLLQLRAKGEVPVGEAIVLAID